MNRNSDVAIICGFLLPGAGAVFPSALYKR